MNELLVKYYLSNINVNMLKNNINKLFDIAIKNFDNLKVIEFSSKQTYYERKKVLNTLGVQEHYIVCRSLEWIINNMYDWLTGDIIQCNGFKEVIDPLYYMTREGYEYMRKILDWQLRIIKDNKHGIIFDLNGWRGDNKMGVGMYQSFIMKDINNLLEKWIPSTLIDRINRYLLVESPIIVLFTEMDQILYNLSLPFSFIKNKSVSSENVRHIRLLIDQKKLIKYQNLRADWSEDELTFGSLSESDDELN